MASFFGTWCIIRKYTRVKSTCNKLQACTRKTLQTISATKRARLLGFQCSSPFRYGLLPMTCPPNPWSRIKGPICYLTPSLLMSYAHVLWLICTVLALWSSLGDAALHINVHFHSIFNSLKLKSFSMHQKWYNRKRRLEYYMQISDNIHFSLLRDFIYRQ